MNEKKIKYYVHSTAQVEEGVSIGDGSYIWNHAQLRTLCKIGMNTIISKNVYIDSECKVGSNVKIQNNVSVYRGVDIEDDVFIGPSVVFTNDLYPRAFNHDWEVVSTTIKKGSSIGAGAVIICGNIIGEYSMIGSGTLIIKDVKPNQLVVGNPGRVIGHVYNSGKRVMKSDVNLNTRIAKCELTKEKIYLDQEDIELYK